MTTTMIQSPGIATASVVLKAWSSFEPYELSEYLLRLEQHLPGVAIDIERMSTAALTQRLLAQADALPVDLILGWADSASRHPRFAGRFFAPGGDADGFLRVTGFSTALVADDELLTRAGVRLRGWPDLALPELEGLIAFPDPAVSGAGFLALTTILQSYGEARGWPLVQAILRNAAVRPGSAWEPARLTGLGEIAVGVTVRIAAMNRQQQQPSLTVIEPADATGTEAEVYAGVVASPHQAVVSQVLAWLRTPEAASVFDGFNKVLLSQPDSKRFMIDAALAVDNRERWLSHLDVMTKEITYER